MYEQLKKTAKDVASQGAKPAQTGGHGFGSNQAAQDMLSGVIEWWRGDGKAAQADKSLNGQSTFQPDPSLQIPTPLDEDGFDPLLAQMHMSAVLEDYQDNTRNGEVVGTEYRNLRDVGEGNEEFEGYQDRISGQQRTEPEMIMADKEAYYALMGKGTPEGVQRAYELAEASGASDRDVEHTVGVDCIGYVMNVLNSHEGHQPYRDLGPENENERRASVNVTPFEEDWSTEVTDPGSWRPMDVVTWSGTAENPRDGHVMMIYSVEENEDGTHGLVLHHSGGSGPASVNVTYDPESGTWAGFPIRDRATVRRPGAPE